MSKTINSSASLRVNGERSRTINVNELQANISEVLSEVKNGEIYEVMRYSEPVAVILSYEDYRHLRGECKRCVEDLRKIASKTKK